MARRLLLLAVFVTGACGGNGSCPIGSRGCECTTGGACDPGLTCTAGTCTDEDDAGLAPADAPGPLDVAPSVYRYLMVVDRSPSDLGVSNLYCGTDIDAVILGRAGATLPATGALSSAGGACLEGPVRTGLATGSPQATCEPDTFASLGGEGGYLVLSFSQPIQPGDSVQVHECTVSGIMDHYDLRIGTSTDPTAPTWVTIAENLTDVVEVIVPALP